MLETLEQDGYVVRSEGAHWRAAGKTISLSAGYSAVYDMGRLVGPVLRDSQDVLKWPASFGIFDRDAMIIADTTRDWRGMMVTRQPHHRPPMLTTSLGRAYLAFMDDDKREDLLDVLRREPTGWNVMAAEPAKVSELIAGVRQKGYAVADANYLAHTFGTDIWGISVPVRGEKELYGSLGLMVLRRVISEGEGVEDLAPRMRDVAGRIAEKLGG
ncbi:IclR family transcriptional regulator domain-containing protein [Pelagibacterium sp.]|uniref:IclR family transcriptional regulator domain-containing protein n=1 Tax=Pelagibacterium sp. TaxID=1967288 RepID=UPI003A8F7790